MSLRPDSLAQIISYANVYAGAQVLTFDTISVVTASLVERMGGYGRILSVHSSQDPPHKEVLSKFNFDYKTLDVLKFVSAFEIFDPKSKEDKDKDACDDEKQVRRVCEEQRSDKLKRHISTYCQIQADQRTAVYIFRVRYHCIKV